MGSDEEYPAPQGPGVVQNLMARRTVSPRIVAVDCAFQNHLVMGWVISSTCSVSWSQLVAELALADRGPDRHDERGRCPAQLVDHLGHGVGQADIGDHDDGGLAGRARAVAVPAMATTAPSLHALDKLDARLVPTRASKIGRSPPVEGLKKMY